VVARANGLGIDTIITDHHLPDSATPGPAALAVLNPNQPGCAYPDKNLCGVGVAFKLAQALLGSLDWTPARFDTVLRSMLRVVAIGTVADVVPLTGENRIIVKFGLEGLRRPVNPGLKALLAIAGFGDGRAPNAGNIAFWLAPRLNAAGRMDTASEVIELFSAADAARAAEIAGRLDRLNADRQQAEARIVAEILENIAAQSSGAESGATALVCAGERWHRGVLGIVASRLVERYYRPTLVISIDPEDGLAHGSGRSIRGFHLLEALESMPELFVRFGGHRQAAGFTLSIDRLAEFRRRFTSYAAERLSADDCVPVLPIDADVALPDLTANLVTALAQLEPCGAGNPEPMFASTGLALAGPPRLLKEKHLRLNLCQQGRYIQAVGWNMGSRAPELQAGGLLDAAFRVEDDDYNGGSRLVLKDILAR
jgi:single-stranded-DNA-specific exonuclease